MCLNAETTPTTLYTYREKLLFLRKLVYSSVYESSDICKDAILRYLIGNLFINFSALWEHLVEIIATHVESPSFWNILKENLLMSRNKCIGKFPFSA